MTPLLMLPLLATNILLVSGACPDGTRAITGDVPGWGDFPGTSPTIAGWWPFQREVPLKTADNMACLQACKNQAGCCSIEWSENDKQCNLNKPCSAQTSNTHKDYELCSLATCPENWKEKVGDVPGWGQFPGTSPKDLFGLAPMTMENIEKCGEKCLATTGCCSIEYSATS